MTVQCYLPYTDAQLERLPRSMAEYARWQSTETELNPFLGRFHWVLQTQLHLQAAGVDARLTNRLEAAGVLYSHVECLTYGIRPLKDQVLIAALVDKDIPLPHAFLHITHNPVQRLPFFARYRYLDPWPQIGLIPRNPKRGPRFENVYFMGNPEHLHPFFLSTYFTDELQQLGLRLVVPRPNEWHDFSEADCLIAVRNFGTSMTHLQRPALKLFNAWLAGIPAILGYESAYRHRGKINSDYLEVQSESEVIQRLKYLADHVGARQVLTGNGEVRAREITGHAVRDRWIRLLEDLIYPHFKKLRGNQACRVQALTMGSLRERVLWRLPGRFRQNRAEMSFPHQRKPTITDEHD